jgi:hypothetical protein
MGANYQSFSLQAIAKMGPLPWSEIGFIGLRSLELHKLFRGCPAGMQ